MFADALQSRCSWKFRNFHRKAPVSEPLFNKVALFWVCNFIKKKLQHRCFPVNFVKFLRIPFFTEHLRWLILSFMRCNFEPKIFLECALSLSFPGRFPFFLCKTLGINYSSMLVLHSNNTLKTYNIIRTIALINLLF